MWIKAIFLKKHSAMRNLCVIMLQSFKREVLLLQGEIQSVVRSFSIIEFLATSTEPQLLKTIADICNLPTSTTHRLLNNLCAMGYAKNLGTGQYKLTYKLFEISSQSIHQTSVISIAKPYLDNLSKKLCQSVHLVVRDDTDVVYVYKVTNSVGSVQMASRIGMHLPMYRTAVGKALLATLPDDEITRIFNESHGPAVTRKTITDKEQLLKNISLIRQNGYAVDDEENEEGVMCFAVTIGRKDAEIQYAFSVSTIKDWISEERQQEIIHALKETREEINRHLFLI